MINTCFKWFKVFLLLEVRKVNFLIAPIFGIHIKFRDLLFLNEFTIVLLSLLPLRSTTLLLLILNTFSIKFDNLVVFNIEITNTVILLKP